MAIIQLGKDMLSETQNVMEKIWKGKVVKLPNKFTAEKDDDGFIIVRNNDKDMGKQAYKMKENIFAQSFLHKKPTEATAIRYERKSIFLKLKRGKNDEIDTDI